MEFLSEAWLAAMDAAVRADAELQTVTQDLPLVIGQEVTGGPDGDVRWHVSLENSRPSVRPGPADTPTIWFSQDHDTAVAIATAAGE